MPKPWERYQQKKPWEIYQVEPVEKEESILPSFVTGEGREAEATKGLPELQESGLLAGESLLKGAAITPALLTATDPNEIADIIKSNFPNVGVTYNKGPEGNVYPILVNNETGAATVINRPGISGLDVIQGLGLAAAYTPAGKAATVLGAGVKSGLTGAAIETGQKLSGGEFDPVNVAADIALGGSFKALESAVGAAYRAAKGKPSQSTQELIDFAETQGLPISTTDVLPPTTFTGKSAQAMGQKVPFVGTGKMQAAKQEAREGLLQDLKKTYGTPSEEEVFESFSRKRDATKQAAGKRYKDISDRMSTQPMSIRKTLGALDDGILKLMARGKIKDTESAKKLAEVRGSLLEGNQTFNTLKENRTLFREKVRGERINFPKTSDRIVNDVYDSMTKNLKKEIRLRYGVKEANRWSKANQYIFNEAEILKKTKLKNILDKGNVTPEVAQNIVFSKNPSEVKALFSRLDKEGRNAGRAALISRALDKSKGSPERFLSAMDAMKDQVGVFFRGKEKKFIDGIGKYLNATREASQAAVRTKSGQELIAPLVLSGAVADIVTGGGAKTAAVATYGLMSRVYESNTIRNLMSVLANAKKGSTKFESTLRDINTYITALSQSQQRQEQ